MVSTFQASLNFAVSGKLPKDGNFEPVCAAKNWKTQSCTIQNLAGHICKGYAWMPGLLNGQRRIQENVVSSYVLTADIDDGWTIQDALAHPFVKKFCALGITSASHSEECHKFRLIFLLPESVDGVNEIRRCNEVLIDYLEVSDKSCKDASRFYFGNTNAEVFLQQEVVLPKDWLEQMSRAIVSRDVAQHFEPSVKANQSNAGEDIETFIRHQVYPRFNLKSAFNWQGHNWAKEDRRTGKLRGSCPWHESQSGTAFYAQVVNGIPLWRCPACDIGGDLIAYRHRLEGGHGMPRGKEFIQLLEGVAREVGVELPKRERLSPTSNGQSASVVSGVAQTESAKGVPSYNEALDWVDALEQQFSSEGELEWAVLSYIKESGLSAIGIRSHQLIKMARARRDGQEAVEDVDAIDILESNEDGRAWIIPGLLPLGSAICFAAAGGVGKTTYIYNLAKHIALGRTWSGYPVKQGKVLIIQTDEPSVDIRDKLDIANYFEVPRGLIRFVTKWRFSQIRQLEALISKHEPSLIVIDSYTAAHAGMDTELSKSSAGDSLYRLRDIANARNCSFIVIHHLNKMDGLRDSSTIKDNVSEVWMMTRDEQESTDQNHLILEITKSRAGIAGRYLMERNPIDYSWLHLGRIDGHQTHLKRVIAELKKVAPRTFSAKQLAERINLDRREIEESLELARRMGLLEGKWAQYTRTDGSSERFRVYGHSANVQTDGNDGPVVEAELPERQSVDAYMF